MMLYEQFHKGINIGGWLSQYDCMPVPVQSDAELETHLQTFITADDIRRIAAWGFDHIRLPVSGFLLYNRNTHTLNSLPLFYLEQCIDWCRECHLNLVLDLHDLWGNIYGAMDEPMPLLTNPDLKENFFDIWEKLAAHLKNTHEICIMFELLNEVSDASGYLWNALYKETVERIRRIDQSRWILIGSNSQNSIAWLSQLDLIDDPLVFYNFHYYDPQVFTHQKAHFSDEMKEFNRTIPYPGDISSFCGYLQKHPEYQSKHALTAHETRNDFALMQKLFKNAENFVLYSGHELYCGEFGVINSAPAEEGAKWVTDLVRVMDGYRIGHAMWNYKMLDFGLLDMEGQPVSQQMIDTVRALNLEG